METWFWKLPVLFPVWVPGVAIFLEASALLLLGSARMGSARGESLQSCGSTPISNGCQHLYWGLLWWGGWKGDAFSQRNTASEPLLLQAVVWGLQLDFFTATMLVGATVGTQLHLQPLPLSHLLYSSQEAHLWMYHWVDLSGIFVCCAGDLLLSYSCLTCKCKGRNKGVLSFCHDADVTLLLLFHHGCFISGLFILVCLLVLWLSF